MILKITLEAYFVKISIFVWTTLLISPFLFELQHKTILLWYIFLFEQIYLQSCIDCWDHIYTILTKTMNINIWFFSGPV